MTEITETSSLLTVKTNTEQFWDADDQRLKERSEAIDKQLEKEALEKKARTPRRYKLWERISDEERDYLLTTTHINDDGTEVPLTPENEPEAFAPLEVRLTEQGYAQLNEQVDLIWMKYGRLPYGVTNWSDARPTYKQMQAYLPKTLQEAQSELIAVRADSIKSKAITWLWNFRVPMNKLTVFAGNPDNGKSLATLYMIAQLTRGLPMYGDTTTTIPPSEVLLMAAEDDSADTLKPRLEAAGADDTKVYILSTMMQKNPNKVLEEREAQLDRDIQSLDNYLKAHPNIRMVVIDPISSFLGRVNMNREQEVRGVLTPLKNLAERRGVAIVTVMHLNKVGDQAAIHRIGGAVAFTGVARAVWLFMQDEEDKNKRLMLRVKNNIAKATGGLVFNITTKPVSIGGKNVEQPVISWVGETDSAASDLVMSNKQNGRPEKVVSATEWLRKFLEGGPETSADIQSFGRKNGYSMGTLQRAKEELRARAFQQDRKWYWELLTKPIAGEPSTNNNVTF